MPALCQPCTTSPPLAPRCLFMGWAPVRFKTRRYHLYNDIIWKHGTYLVLPHVHGACEPAARGVLPPRAPYSVPGNSRPPRHTAWPARGVPQRQHHGDHGRRATTIFRKWFNRTRDSRVTHMHSGSHEVHTSTATCSGSWPLRGRVYPYTFSDTRAMAVRVAEP